MTSHQRVVATLDGQPVDRVPVDVWLTREALDSLRQHTGRQDELALYQHLGVDKIVWIFPGYQRDNYDPNDGGWRDPWGVPSKTVRSGQATYSEQSANPLAAFEDPDDLDSYPFWPDPEGFNIPAAIDKANRAREAGFATIGPWISHFEIYCRMRGMENALVDVIDDPGFLEASLDRIDDIQTRMLTRFLDALGDRIDLVFISDDMGTQKGQLISTKAYLRHFQPRLARWCDLVHAHGKRVLFHTDGAARDLVPHLAEAGVDVLNPIQHICPGMDRAGLARDFGARLAFHGGVENQHVLPHGNPDDVRAETWQCLKSLGARGRYIPCSCHNIQAGTPVDNILALIDAVHQWQP